jgi:hypothetical protein
MGLTLVSSDAPARHHKQLVRAKAFIFPWHDAKGQLCQAIIPFSADRSRRPVKRDELDHGMEAVTFKFPKHTVTMVVPAGTFPG